MSSDDPQAAARRQAEAGVKDLVRALARRAARSHHEVEQAERRRRNQNEKPGEHDR